MQISISGRHLTLPDRAQEYIRSKASKLEQFFDKIQTVDVIVAKEGLGFAMEIIVKPDHHESFVANQSGKDIYSCTDLILGKIERQVTRHKEKIRNHKHRSAGQEQEPPEA